MIFVSTTRAHRIFFGLMLLAGITLRLHASLAEKAPPLKDAFEYDRLAMSILDGKGFSDPKGKLEASRPPLYPVFLSAIYRLTGHEYRHVRIVQALLSTTVIFLIFDIASVLFGVTSGLWAGWVAALYPAFYAYYFGCHALLTETLYVTLLTAVLWSLVRYINSPKRSFAWICAATLSLAILTRPIPLPLVVLLPLLLLIIGCQKRLILRLWGRIIVAFILIVGPWTWRNYIVFGRLVPIYSGAGTDLYSSYHEGPIGGGSGIDAQGKPIPGPAYNFTQGILYPQWEKMIATGVSDVDISRYFFAEALSFIRKHPWETLRRYLWYGMLYLDPRTTIEREGQPIVVITWGYVAVCVGSLLSLLHLRKDRNALRSLLLLYILFGYFLFVHSVLIGSERYRFPAESILIVTAAPAWAFLSRWLITKQAV